MTLNPICAFYASGRNIGTICSLQVDGRVAYGLFIGKDCEKRVDIHVLDNNVADEPLKNLSSNEYAVITDKYLITKNKMYQASGSIPNHIQWMVVPILEEDDLIDYSGGNALYDDLFLAEGYARELAEACHIFVPPLWDSDRYVSLDLLIKESKDDVFVPYSGRNLRGIVSKRIEGRYIFLEKVPEVTGDIVDVPYTYTPVTLANKYWVLQDRLQKYGSSRIESICACLNGIAASMRESSNHFKTSQTYDMVSSMVEKIRNSL